MQFPMSQKIKKQKKKKNKRNLVLPTKHTYAIPNVTGCTIKKYKSKHNRLHYKKNKIK